MGMGPHALHWVLIVVVAVAASVAQAYPRAGAAYPEGDGGDEQPSSDAPADRTSTRLPSTNVPSTVGPSTRLRSTGSRSAAAGAVYSDTTLNSIYTLWGHDEDAGGNVAANGLYLV